MNIPDDLDFLTTEALLETLSKRFNASLFIAHSDRSNEEDALTFATNGSVPACYGLAHIAVDHFRNEPLEPEGE